MPKVKEPKKPKKSYLIVQPVDIMGFGDYNYFVETPEEEVLYFSDKKQARAFIEFYRNHKGKKIAKVVNSYIEYR